MTTVVTKQSWSSRLGSAFKGILFGLIMFFGSIALLFWNEGRTVETKKALNEGASNVIETDAQSIKSETEGKLVHLVGKMETKDILIDEEFLVEVEGIKLKRNVEVYQWSEESISETTKDMGGSTTTETTYSYKKIWADGLINSSSFQESGHDNPTSVPYESELQDARGVTVGAYKLTDSLLSQANNYQELPLQDTIKLPENAKKIGQTIYIGKDETKPEIGDMKISFSAVMPNDVTIISQQKGDTFTPYVAKNGKKLEFLRDGQKTADEIFTAAQEQNKMTAWILRLLGFLLMMGGIRTILKPLEIIGDVVPIIGNIIGFGSGIIAFLVAAPISLITIAVAWIYYRPVLGISLLVIAGAGIVYLVKKVRAPKVTNA